MITRSLFTPTCAIDQLNEDFLLVSNHRGYIPAKKELIETFSSHPNPDGNFIEQFQSKNGFNARVWELYLLAFFLDAGFRVNCDDDSPDFFISNEITEVAVEAVTTNEGNDKEIFIKNDEQHRDFVAKKLGSSLYSKWQEKYWEKTNISGLPLIFAIAPFHSQDSLYDSDSSLIEYLYGIQWFGYYDSQGNLMVENKEKKVHQYKNKQIPSGFFNLPGSENISAVLFSNSGTVAKFNRMGYLKKPELYSHLIMKRQGCAYSHAPNASKPNVFSYVVGDLDFPESWGQGIHIFHNPKANHPLDWNFFNDVAQSTLRDGALISSIPRFFPTASQTIIVNIVE